MLKQRYGITREQLSKAAAHANAEFQKCAKYCPNICDSIDTTTTTTVLGAMITHYLSQCCDNPLLSQPKEKGYPDLIHPTNNLIGIDVKCTVNNSFAAHHRDTENILTVRWKATPEGLPEVYEIGCMLDLTPDDFTHKKDEKNTKNTPICYVKRVNDKKRVLWSTVPLKQLTKSDDVMTKLQNILEGK